MSWERQLDELFAELEQQAEGMALADRDAAVAELSRAEYAEVELAARVHASVGSVVELDVLGAGTVRGRLVSAGAGWCLVAPDLVGSGAATPAEWLVALDAVLAARGLPPGARPAAARPVTHRLGLGSVLRQAAEAVDPVVVVRRDGTARQGALGRVGADFVELVVEPARVELVPFSGLALVRPR